MENLIEKIIFLSPSLIAIILFGFLIKLYVILNKYLMLKIKYLTLKIKELENK
jgi:hypothetical protein